jgi:hypothetical protein
VEDLREISAQWMTLRECKRARDREREREIDIYQE